MMDDNTELKIWAAGIFDGEGSALIEKNTGGSYNIVVAITTTDIRMITPFLDAWGGRVRTKSAEYLRNHGTKGARKRGFWLYFDRGEAEKMLTDIYPYLRVKRDEASVVLEAIRCQEEAIRGRGLRGSSFVLAPFYEALMKFKGK